jgi:hypothetical protein
MYAARDSPELSKQVRAQERFERYSAAAYRGVPLACMALRIPGWRLANSWFVFPMARSVCA